MKYGDSAERKRSNPKPNSGDRTHKSFNTQLRKPGAIVESDPYIRDADDKITAKSCLDQLYSVFCFCLEKKKNNQVKPLNGYKRFEPHSNGTMGNGAAGGTKHPDPKPTTTAEKPSDRDKKHVEKFEYTATSSDGRNNLSIYPTETGNFEATHNGVFSIPVEVETADKNKAGVSTGTGVAGQAHYPNAKAKENIEKIFKISDDDGTKDSKPHNSTNFHSSTDKSSNRENYESTTTRYNQRPGTPHTKYGDSSLKNQAYPGDTTDFGAPKNFYGESRTRTEGKGDVGLGWSDIKIDQGFNDENKQFQPHYKHSESKNFSQDYPGNQAGNYHGGTQSYDYNNSFGAKKSDDRTFVDNFRKKDESWKPSQGTYPTNSQSYNQSDKRYDNERRDPDDPYSKRQSYKNSKKDSDEQESKFDDPFSKRQSYKNSRKDSDDQESKFKGDKTSPKKHHSQHEKQKNYGNQSYKNGNSWRNSTEEEESSKNSQHEKQKNYGNQSYKNGNSWRNSMEEEEFSKNQSRSHHNGRGKYAGHRRGEDSTSNERDSRYPSKKDGLILNPSKLKNAEERDYRFSKDEKEKSRAGARGPLSADATRKNGARVRDDGDRPGLSKDASRGFKSVPNLDDEFVGSRSRPSQRY